MLAKVESFGLQGIDGFPVTVEVDITNGLPMFETVGLPDAAVKESRERVRSAVRNSGYDFPISRITVNLAPADVRKEGPMYDLPIALGILLSSGQISSEYLEGAVIVGELSLDGCIRQVNGILPMIISARKLGKTRFIIPSANRNEASCIDGIEVYAVDTLTDAVSYAQQGGSGQASRVDYHQWTAQSGPRTSLDFRDIRGQAGAKRAMEVAAAGGHNIILIGPPGSGKTMLARSLPGILPAMTFDEALEVTKIHSVAGSLTGESIVGERPFRSPHHTASSASITGGGTKARPGEVSLAHYGVLFLDELPEYPRNTLEALRQPVEDGVITVTRVQNTVCYPARFMLVAGMNPCPCGNFGSRDRTCKCTPLQISRYLGKVSGPLLDRIDIQIFVEPVTYSQISEQKYEETSDAVKERVQRARDIQAQRFVDRGIYSNSEISAAMIHELCPIDSEGEKLLKAAFTSMKMSARAYSRVLKVARTIADLGNSKQIGARHIAEAIQYRNLDRQLW